MNDEERLKKIDNRLNEIEKFRDLNSTATKPPTSKKKTSMEGLEERLGKMEGRHLRLLNRLAYKNAIQEIKTPEDLEEKKRELKEYFNSNPITAGVTSALYSRLDRSIKDTIFTNANLGIVIEDNNVNTNYDIENIKNFMTHASINGKKEKFMTFSRSKIVNSEILKHSENTNAYIGIRALTENSSIAEHSHNSNTKLLSKSSNKNSSIANYSSNFFTNIAENSINNNSRIANHSFNTNSTITPDSTNINGSEIGNYTNNTDSLISYNKKERKITGTPQEYAPQTNPAIIANHSSNEFYKKQLLDIWNTREKNIGIYSRAQQIRTTRRKF